MDEPKEDCHEEVVMKFIGDEIVPCKRVKPISLLEYYVACSDDDEKAREDALLSFAGYKRV